MHSYLLVFLAWVKSNGLCYKPKAGIIIYVEDDLPVVGQIEEIYVADKITIFLKVTQCLTYYEPHYRAYTFLQAVLSYCYQQNCFYLLLYIFVGHKHWKSCNFTTCIMHFVKAVCYVKQHLCYNRSLLCMNMSSKITARCSYCPSCIGLRLICRNNFGNNRKQKN